MCAAEIVENLLINVMIFHSTQIKVHFLTIKTRLSTLFCKCYTFSKSEENTLQNYAKIQCGGYKKNESCPL